MDPVWELKPEALNDGIKAILYPQPIGEDELKVESIQNDIHLIRMHNIHQN